MNSSRYKIGLEGNISVESIFNDDSEIDKNIAKAETEVAKLNRSGMKIISNFNKIGINENNNLVISGNELCRLYDNSLNLYKNRFTVKIPAEQNKNKFTFQDGSEIITDSRGMLTFKSSNTGIPTFYIPSTEYGFLALATHTEYGGSEYYLPKQTLLKVKTMEEMYAQYLTAFIDQILDYGA